MNIVIIDDDDSFLKLFRSKVLFYSRKIFDNVQIDISTDISILENNMYSIYFLDIDLIEENGIDIARKIKKTNSNVKIIFTSSNKNLIFNAITVQPFYFIRKSDLDNDLATAFILIQEYFTNKPFYSFKYQTDIIKIYIEDIIYFETNDHLTTIFTNSKQYYLYKPLKEILIEISSPLISQVNRNQCINLSHITSEEKNYIILDSCKKIKIGNTYKKKVKEQIEDYILERDVNYGFWNI